MYMPQGQPTTQSPFHQARSLPQGTLKTVCDGWNGYDSVPLHQDDRHLATFITPYGRYRYCTAPQGDGYSRQLDETASNFPNKTKCTYDTLLWADSLKESFYQTSKWLNLCGRNGITLNPENYKFNK